MKEVKIAIVLMAALLFAFTVPASGQATKKKVVTLKLAHVLDEESAWGMAAKKMADLAEQKSGGTLKIAHYPNSQLGGEREVLEGLKIQTVDMGIFSDGITGTFIPDMSVFSLPFLIPNVEVFDKFMNSPKGDLIIKQGLNLGLKILQVSPTGYRHVTNNIRPIAKASDFAGIRMRTQQNKMQIDTMNAMGASGTPIPFPEIYTALQTGVVDGQYNDYQAIVLRKFYEQQKYCTEIPLFISLSNLIIGKKTWEALSPEHQKILLEIAKETRPVMIKLRSDAEDKHKETILKYGKIKFNQVKDSDSFIKALQPLHEKYLKENPSWVSIYKALKGN